MRFFWRMGLLVWVTAALALAACDDDGTPTDTGGNGTPDTTPPEVDSVAAVDVFHVEVIFNETVQRASAEQRQYYTIVEQPPAPAASGREGAAAAPGDTLTIGSVSLKSDDKTAVVSLFDNMTDVPYDIYVCCIEDESGNKMAATDQKTFTGSTAADNSPPEIVYASPADGATGVGTAQPVMVQFSEMVQFSSVLNGFAWTGGGGDVPHDTETNNEITFLMTPTTTLSTNTTYTVSLTGVRDYANNTMGSATWSFTTTRTTDTTPPSFVSSVPSHGQTNVDVNTNLSLTFSEPIDQTDFQPLLSPSVGDGVDSWSDGGRTVTFDPDQPLQSDTQYYLAMLPGDVRDLSGNPMEEPVEIRFTTGSSFDDGSFSGTISGDPNTPAADPEGALVIAPDVLIFETDDFDVYGSDVAGSNGNYAISQLPDDVYYPVGAMDSNGDGDIDPETGDAIGVYGIDIRGADITPDSVVISGGNAVTDVDFPLFDQSAVYGTFSYDGTTYSGDYPVYIGAFDVNGFDIDNLPEPDFGTDAYWPYSTEFWMNEMETLGFVPGNYYIGAYMDVGDNGDYDPETDPAGFYGGVPNPTAVDLTDGQDAVGIHISLLDPSGPAAPPVSWQSSGKRDVRWFQRLSAAVRRAANQQSALR